MKLGSRISISTKKDHQRRSEKRFWNWSQNHKIFLQGFTGLLTLTARTPVHKATNRPGLLKNRKENSWGKHSQAATSTSSQKPLIDRQWKYFLSVQFPTAGRSSPKPWVSDTRGEAHPHRWTCFAAHTVVDESRVYTVSRWIEFVTHRVRICAVNAWYHLLRSESA